MASFLYPALAALLGQQQSSGPTAREALGLSPGPVRLGAQTPPLQTILGQPGPSRPMWMAPVMENQQLLQTGMDPSVPPAQRLAANQAFGQEALRTALAFGGADITKEQRAAWEAENAAYRAGRDPVEGTYSFPYPAATRADAYPPGTRVRQATTLAPTKFSPPGEPGYPLPEGVVVKPGTPEAGKSGHPDVGRIYRDPKTGDLHQQWTSQKPPTPEHIAVRNKGSDQWWWMHSGSLEVLPPEEEFPHGSDVTYTSINGVDYSGTVAQPPAGTHPPPGSDWVWVDMPGLGTPRRGVKPGGDMVPPIGIKEYAGDAWGAWFRKADLKKK